MEHARGREVGVGGQCWLWFVYNIPFCMCFYHGWLVYIYIDFVLSLFSSAVVVFILCVLLMFEAALGIYILRVYNCIPIIMTLVVAGISQ